MFSALLRTRFAISANFNQSSANALNLDRADSLLFGKGLTLSKQQILESSKLKEFVDDNFRFDENGRKFYKRVQNVVGKGEIARCEQFLLFQLFSKDLYYIHIKTRACLGKG